MSDFSANHRPAFSERLYRLLLRAYPRAFRDDFGTEMLLIFRDAADEATRRWGRWGVLRLWCDITVDFVTSVCVQRVRAWMPDDARYETRVGKEQFVMALQFTVDVGQRTDIGRERASNEDNLITVVPEDQHLLQSRGVLFVVSDGMGGQRRGEVASELAIQTVKEAYFQNVQHDIPTALQAAVGAANAAIFTAGAAERDGGGQGLGATCVAAVIHEHMLYAANVGDSRVYVLHDGQLRQITRDHSLVAQMVERGELSAAEARTHEKRNIIYRALGSVAVEVDLFTEPVVDGDTIILCTDGLCGVVPDDEIQAIVTHYSPAESVQELIAHANAAGGPDNVTAIVARVATA